MSPPDDSVELGEVPSAPLSRWRYAGVGLTSQIVCQFLCVVVILWIALQFVHGPGKFHENYQGMKELDVVAKLGQPHRDSRRFQQAAGNQNGEYKLFRHYGIEQGLSLHFNNGIVVKQSNDRR